MKRPDRKPMRVLDYDYAQPGAYYVTICTYARDCFLAEIINTQVILSNPGTIVWAAWTDLPQHYAHLRLDDYIIMPNHIHAIVILTDSPSSTSQPRRHGLFEIVRAFKTWSARRINEMRNEQRLPVWQRSFYDHIVRDDADLNRIRAYINENPAKWAEDQNNPLRW